MQRTESDQLRQRKHVSTTLPKEPEGRALNGSHSSIPTALWDPFLGCRRQPEAAQGESTSQRETTQAAAPALQGQTGLALATAVQPGARGRSQHWPRLPRGAVESPSREIFKTRLDKVLYSLL